MSRVSPEFEVIEIMDKKGSRHFDEQGMTAVLEDLRDRGEASYDAQSLDDFELGDDEYEDLLDGRFDIYIHTIELTEAQEVLQALHEINRHRGKVGQRPLDPVDAGWGPEDVIAEAERLQRARNAAQLKRRLM